MKKPKRPRRRSKPAGFKCPRDDCNGITVVKRTTTHGPTIRRIRVCGKCKKRFFTVEGIPGERTNSEVTRIYVESLISAIKSNPFARIDPPQ